MKASCTKPASRPPSRWALLGAPPGTSSDLPVIGEKMSLMTGICNVHSTLFPATNYVEISSGFFLLLLLCVFLCS